MSSIILFRALIHPGAYQPDLFLGQRGNFGLVAFRRHPMIFLAEIRDAEHQTALGAVAGFDDLAFLGAFERGFETRQLQPGLGFLVAVALHTGRVEDGFNVGSIGDVGLGRGRREFAKVYFRFVIGRNGRQGEGGRGKRNGQTHRGLFQDMVFAHSWYQIRRNWNERRLRCQKHSKLYWCG